MPASPAPADPGRDDDLAWLDRDPMTAQEREASLDRLCEQDEGYREDAADEYDGLRTVHSAGAGRDPAGGGR